MRHMVKQYVSLANLYRKSKTWDLNTVITNILKRHSLMILSFKNYTLAPDLIVNCKS